MIPCRGADAICGRLPNRSKKAPVLHLIWLRTVEPNPPSLWARDLSIGGRYDHAIYSQFTHIEPLGARSADKGNTTQQSIRESRVAAEDELSGPPPSQRAHGASVNRVYRDHRAVHRNGGVPASLMFRLELTEIYLSERRRTGRRSADEFRWSQHTPLVIHSLPCRASELWQAGESGVGSWGRRPRGARVEASSCWHGDSRVEGRDIPRNAGLSVAQRLVKRIAHTAISRLLRAVEYLC